MTFNETCATEISDVLPPLSPLLLAMTVVSALASSQDTPTVGRFTSFGFATVVHIAYVAVSDWTGLYEDHDIIGETVTEDDWLSSLQSAQLYIDIGVLALLLLQAFGTSVLPRVAWMVIAGLSGLVHLVDVLQGGLVSAQVVVASLMATGVLDSIGQVVDRATTFLPPMLRVCCPVAHQVLAVLFIILGAAIGGEEPFGDVVVQPQLIAAGIAFVGIYTLEYSALEGSVGQLVTVVTAASGVVTLHWIASDVHALAPQDCNPGTALQVVSSAIDPNFTHIASAIAAAFSAAAAAMTAAIYIDVHYQPTSTGERIVAALLGKHGNPAVKTTKPKPTNGQKGPMFDSNDACTGVTVRAQSLAIP